MSTSKAKHKKVMITCAVTGAIHTPTMSPHLPITADQIADAALEAHAAGAALCTCMHETLSMDGLINAPRPLPLS